MINVSTMIKDAMQRLSSSELIFNNFLLYIYKWYGKMRILIVWIIV